MHIKTITTAAGVLALSAAASAQSFDVIGGQTSVLLDTDTLSSAASLNLSSVSPDVIAPGSLGDGSVAFGINPRDAASLPTTFSYEAGLASFGGTIEHTGSVFFNMDSVEVGNFTIGYDGTRVGGDRSGFFVASTTGISAILFDVASPDSLSATADGLDIRADLLVSSEFATFLRDAGLASADLTGADVGDALVEGVVPAPGAAVLVGVAGLGAAIRRRR
ncbi:MAG: hypothetical protein ACIAQU_11205 [Phycisphaerales bacterium JB064]